MREKALLYYKNGNNCSQCLIMAAFEKYGLGPPKEAVLLCEGVSSGFGVCSVCGALVAGVMIFGLIFDSSDIKSARIRLFDMFVAKYHTIDCGGLKSLCSPEDGCEWLICSAADIIDGIIGDRPPKAV